jgi:ankyrin repeat protein
VSVDGMTPLMQAIDFGDYDVVSALIICYPEIVQQKFYDPQNRHEWILPLHFAALLAGRSQDLDSAVKILSFIVEQYPDDLRALSATDSRGRTPLHLAVTGKSRRAAKWLLEKGADVNARDSRGRCPLHYVSSAVDLADMLLSSRADLDAKDMDGLSPLYHVCQRDSLDVLNMFIERKAVLDTSLYGTLLHSAIIGRSKRIMSTLLDKGIEVNSQNSDGDTPLHIATRISRADIVKALLIANADSTIANHLGQVPLHIASSICNSTIVRHLLSHDNAEAAQADFHSRTSSVNALDIHRKTPLHLASKRANVTVANLLLSHGASERIRDRNGRTPLHMAVDMYDVNYGHPEMFAFCRLLLRHKELLLVQDNRGQLAWHLAWKNRNFALLSLFFSKTYSMAGPQLALKDPESRINGSTLMKTAINQRATYLVESLLAEMEPLGIQLPYSVKYIIDSALLDAVHLAKARAVKRGNNYSKVTWEEKIKNLESKVFKTAGFVDVLLNAVSSSDIIHFIKEQPYYREEILLAWIDLDRSGTYKKLWQW